MYKFSGGALRDEVERRVARCAQRDVAARPCARRHGGSRARVIGVIVAATATRGCGGGGRRRRRGRDRDARGGVIVCSVVCPCPGPQQPHERRESSHEVSNTLQRALYVNTFDCRMHALSSLDRRYSRGCCIPSTDPAGPQIPVAEVPRSLGRAVLVLLTSVTWRAVFCPFVLTAITGRGGGCRSPHGVGLGGVP